MAFHNRMANEKLLRVQTNFRSLVSELGDCWYLSEQNGNYSQALTKLLKRYHKISWLDECLQILDEDYFRGHYDGSVVRKDHRYTQQLHEILCALAVKNVFGQNLWSEFVFGMSVENQQNLAEKYNLYRKEYAELVEEARIKWEASGNGDGGGAQGSPSSTA
jgi:hypothetical protein